MPQNSEQELSQQDQDKKDELLNAFAKIKHAYRGMSQIAYLERIDKVVNTEQAKNSPNLDLIFFLIAGLVKALILKDPGAITEAKAKYPNYLPNVKDENYKEFQELDNVISTYSERSKQCAQFNEVEVNNESDGLKREINDKKVWDNFLARHPKFLSALISAPPKQSWGSYLYSFWPSKFSTTELVVESKPTLSK